LCDEYANLHFLIKYLGGYNLIKNRQIWVKKMIAPVRCLRGVTRPRVFLCLGLVGFIAACAPAPDSSEFYDPNEKFNRKVHSFNILLDKNLLRPTASAYGAIIPDPVKSSFSNFAANLDGPSNVVNDFLQAEISDATMNSLRFLVNSTIGLGGLFDPATQMGLAAKPNDFGATLAAWALPEGKFVMLPAFGPSTDRAAVGLAVDIVFNPISSLMPELDPNVIFVAKVANILNERDRYSDTFDSLLYESADSYAQTRLLYMQNRRFSLAPGEVNVTDAYDPYEEFGNGN
jgi:phospholipid-binding lipoprotein MlaA